MDEQTSLIQPGDSAVPAAASGLGAVLLPHLDAAYNLARWLTRNDHDAADTVQEAFVRALRSADTYRGNGAKTWLLTIVRNAAFDRMRRDKSRAAQELDDNLHVTIDHDEFDPHAILMRAANAERVREAIHSLPPGVREVVVLREMEGLSYREIAVVIASPIGTVMSRLARGPATINGITGRLGRAEWESGAIAEGVI